MRWTACLATTTSLSLALLAAGGCNSGASSQQKPVTVAAASASRPTKPFPAAEEKILRERAQLFMTAFVSQDFTQMWNMIDAQSQAQVGMPNFTSQYDYRKGGSIVGTPEVQSVGELEKDKALVRTVIHFQYAPSLFGGEPVFDDLVWDDEWIRHADGQWFRLLRDPRMSEEKRKEMEELCQSIFENEAPPKANP